MEQSYPALQSAKAQLQGLAAKYLCQSYVGVFAGYSFKVCNIPCCQRPEHELNEAKTRVLNSC